MRDYGRQPAKPGALVGGRYILQDGPGRGGQAEVWRALDERGTVAAVKIYKAEAAEDPAFSARVAREVQHSRDLAHSGLAVVDVLDEGEDEHGPFIVMEWMSGGSVRDLLKRAAGPLPLGRALRLIFEAAETVDAVHDRNCLHRDISPDNLLLNGHGHVFLGDFGIARGEHDVTVTSGLIGKWRYTAPEQFSTGAVKASDRYSLAVVAFELLAGAVPFSVQDNVAAARLDWRREVPSLHARRPDLPAAVDEVFQSALEQDPAVRAASYPTAVQFAEGLLLALVGDGIGDDALTNLLGEDEATWILPRATRVAEERRNYRSRWWSPPARPGRQPLVDALRRVAKDVGSLPERIRAEHEQRPWFLPAAAAALAIPILAWVALIAQAIIGDWAGALPGPARGALAVAALAAGLQLVAGVPETREDRYRAGGALVLGSALVVELWSVTLAGDGTSLAIPLLATALALVLALLWRHGHQELVLRLFLVILAVGMSAALTELELIVATSWLWKWQEVNLDRYAVDDLATMMRWIAGLAACVAALHQATRTVLPLRRNIVAVPVWAALFASSVCIVAWALASENLAEPLGPYLGSYAIVCAVAMAVATAITFPALALHRRHHSSPHGFLVWLALAAWVVALATLQIAALGPERVFEEYLAGSPAPHGSWPFYAVRLQL